MATNLDSQLFSRGGKDDAAGSGADVGMTADESVIAQPTLREAVLAEKRRRAVQAQKEAKLSGAAGGVAGVLSSPLKAATGNLLKQSWLHLIDSFGLTLIWINIHVFLRLVLGEKFFCKLGEEWALSVPAAGAVPGVTKMTGTAEAMALGALDLLAMFVVMSILSIIAMIINVISNPLEAIKTIFGLLWGALSG